MTYLMSIIMGIIQGIAEFLPISSSGHLALFQAFFGMEDVETSHMFFAVLLHFGTFLSVCIVYRQDIVDMVREFFLGIGSLFSGKRGKGTPPPARRLVMLIVIATMPLFVMVFLKDYIAVLFQSTFMVSLALLATGFLLFFADRLPKGRKTAKNATVGDAVLVGVAQAIAVIPGLSRSGTTISAGIFQGFDRGFAVRFSFLMSLPAVLGANILELKDAVETGFDFSLLPIYLAGVLTATVVGYFSIRLVKSMADKGKFGRFAYYCWAVGAISLIAGLFLK